MNIIFSKILKYKNNFGRNVIQYAKDSIFINSHGLFNKNNSMKQISKIKL